MVSKAICNLKTSTIILNDRGDLTECGLNRDSLVPFKHQFNIAIFALVQVFCFVFLYIKVGQ